MEPEADVDRLAMAICRLTRGPCRFSNPVHSTFVLIHGYVPVACRLAILPHLTWWDRSQGLVTPQQPLT